MLDNDCDGEIDEGIDCQCTWFGDDAPMRKTTLDLWVGLSDVCVYQV